MAALMLVPGLPLQAEPPDTIECIHKGYTSPTMRVRGARAWPKVAFLQPQRDWERVDIFAPGGAEADDKLPCIIIYYGGGYGDKVLPGGSRNVEMLLERGYVVAIPDYALATGAPVPLCAWDAANAVRFLRANAATYHIDPERIGVWGFSAGGWIAQDLFYSDTSTLVPLIADRSRRPPVWAAIPAIEPRPLHADQSYRVQAVVSDWGAGKLSPQKDGRKGRWDHVSPDDPPLLTCFEAAEPSLVGSVKLLRSVGVPADAVFMNRGTHCPPTRQPSKGLDGKDTTWGGAIVEFFDRHVENPAEATAPEVQPHGGVFAKPVTVRMLTVHAGGAIHYTLDGSEPTEGSPKYDKPFTVQPDATLKAMVVKSGLRPSRIATAAFQKGPPAPRITSDRTVFRAKVGQPFRARFGASGLSALRWHVAGKVGESYRRFHGEGFNPPKHIAWMAMDAQEGVLTGTPRKAGVYPVIVAAYTMSLDRHGRPAEAAADARLVIVVVEAAD